MELARRSFLGLIPALALASPRPGDDTVLSCFLREELPLGCLAMYDKTAMKPAWVLLDSEADKSVRKLTEYATVHPDPDSPPLLKLESGHFLATLIRTGHFIAVPVEIQGRELEKAARGLLAAAAVQGGWTHDPERWFEDRDLPFDRVVEIDDWTIAVTTPEYLGRHAIYREGISGLSIHNPNAAVIVWTDKTIRKVAKAMVQPIRCGGWDYKVKS